MTKKFDERPYAGKLVKGLKLGKELEVSDSSFEFFTAISKEFPFIQGISLSGSTIYFPIPSPILGIYIPTEIFRIWVFKTDNYLCKVRKERFRLVTSVVLL